MKKTFLFIFFTALAFTVYGAPLIPTESYPDDYNPYDSGDGSVVCAQMDEVATAEKPCCQGLEGGHGGKCFEPTIVDPGLSSCTSSASCPSGTACMPMSSKDLFSRSSPSWGKEEFDDLKSILTMQLADDEELKKIGDSCSHASECPSYSCVAGKCAEKKVCRFARLKESPAFGQRCGEGYILVNGICDHDPKSKYPIVNNFIDSFEYIQTGNQCSSFKLAEGKEAEGIKALKEVRAFEWLIMSQTVDPYNDCFGLSAALKDEIMKAFHEGRKQATDKFAKNLAEIEKDTYSLTHAKEIGDQTILIHGVESITGKELDTRLASGRDAMFLLMRRNSFFIEYEQEMFDLTEELVARFVKMQEALLKWQNGDESWDLGVRKSGFKECSARYKVWKPIKWRWKDYRDVSNRWGFAYTLNPNKGDVKEILDKKSILENLAKILNKTDSSEVKSQLFLPATQPFGINRTFLVDPLMHGGILAKNYGQHTSDGHRGFLGLGRRDRHPYANNPNLSKMYSDRKENFISYLKNFRPNETVNYEYELMPYMDQACLNKGEACKTFAEHKDKFAAYVDDVMDISMAQFLAFSLRTRKDNTDYFNDPDSGRSRFFLSAIGSFSTLQSYYLGSIEMQSKQNECLSKVINGIDESGINQPGGGIKEGEYYDPNLANPGTVGNGTQPTTVKPIKGNQLAAGNIGGGFPKSLLSGGTSSLGNTGGSIKGSGNNFGRGNSSLSDQNLASFSKRKTDINEKNKLAISKGVKNNGPKKEYAETMDSMQKGDALSGSGRGGNTSGAGMGSSGSLSNSSFGKGNGTGVGTSEGDETDASKISGVGTSEGEIPPGNQGIGINTASGLGQNYGNGSGSSEGDNASSLTDQTGMSDEEKNQMLAVYERTKHRYDSDGEDGIFEKVSKAYVRNLEKILVRKKSID